MSSFYASQGNSNDKGGAQGYSLDQHQGLPNYNNNYEQRFQTLQYGSTHKPNGFSMTQSFSPSPQQPLNVNVYEVRFKCTKGDYLLTDSLRVKPGEFVKVEADRGYDIGIIFKKKVVNLGMEIPRKRILGHIGPDEMSILPHKIAEETQAVAICRQMAVHRGLQITIADVEFQFDRNKLTVIFASEGRVDFRELVRDMFSFFRIRIWMQKVSPSEAIALLELAAADGAGRGGLGSNRGTRSPPPPGTNSAPYERTGSGGSNGSTTYERTGSGGSNGSTTYERTGSGGSNGSTTYERSGSGASAGSGVSNESGSDSRSNSRSPPLSMSGLRLSPPLPAPVSAFPSSSYHHQGQQQSSSSDFRGSGRNGSGSSPDDIMSHGNQDKNMNVNSNNYISSSYF